MSITKTEPEKKENEMKKNQTTREATREHLARIDAKAPFRVYRDQYGWWTFPATKRHFESASAAAHSAVEWAKNAASFVERQVMDAKRAEAKRVYFGNHGAILQTIEEIGSELDVLRYTMEAK